MRSDRDLCTETRDRLLQLRSKHPHSGRSFPACQRFVAQHYGDPCRQALDRCLHEYGLPRQRSAHHHRGAGKSVGQIAPGASFMDRRPNAGSTPILTMGAVSRLALPAPTQMVGAFARQAAQDRAAGRASQVIRPDMDLRRTRRVGSAGRGVLPVRPVQRDPRPIPDTRGDIFRARGHRGPRRSGAASI